MKKLITICLIMATTFAVKAQPTKPTKEQTISFMKGVLESMVGQPFHGNHNITQVSFNGDNYKYTLQNIHNKELQFQEFRSIKWDSYTSSTTEEGLKGGIDFNAWFDIKIESISEYSKDFAEYVDFHIPSSKKESFEKACQRLSEIAKEENKDPFQN